jgi:tripartite-type tricarboxylate transporter receptor subunit TctC
MRHLSDVVVMVSLLALADAAIPVYAQYPDPAKRITLVVPFSAGGSNDILSRAIGQKLSDAWQLPVTSTTRSAPAARLEQRASPRQPRMAIRS